MSGVAGYEDVNDADRLGRDAAMRWIVGSKAVQGTAASTSQMGRFETGWLANDGNFIADLSGRWIDRVHTKDTIRRFGAIDWLVAAHDATVVASCFQPYGGGGRRMLSSIERALIYLLRLIAEVNPDEAHRPPVGTSGGQARFRRAHEQSARPLRRDLRAPRLCRRRRRAGVRPGQPVPLAWIQALVKVLLQNSPRASSSCRNSLA
jgi:DDE family transposase